MKVLNRSIPFVAALAALGNPAAQAEDSAVALAAGKLMNPDIGANFLGLYRHGIYDTATNGFSLQEAEVQFNADVDPYFRAVALFSIAPQTDKPSEYSIDPEEVYAETISFPYVTFRGGKFKAAFGRHNTLHTHAFPFIDAPLINTALFGEEGLNQPGLSAATLLPTSWFSEFTVQGLASHGEPLFNSPVRGDLIGLAQYKNLWDLTDDLTLEHELFGAVGKNELTQNSFGYGTDLTIKWRPAEGGKYRALIWTTEYMQGYFNGSADQPRLGGLATWLQYQFAQRWWAQARTEWLGLPEAADAHMKTRQSALLGFFPSEFSGFRVQYDHVAQQDVPTDHVISLQWNISIGAHPAHAY